ncbi:MAG: hypothetical protein LLG02_02530 [Pelosinus sp.]|nr:hypothetical protein [Pelosinus sp.]
MSELQTHEHNHGHSKGYSCGCGCDHGAKKEISFLNGKLQLILGTLTAAAIAASFFFKF